MSVLLLLCLLSLFIDPVLSFLVSNQDCILSELLSIKMPITVRRIKCDSGEKHIYVVGKNESESSFADWM